MDRFHEMTVFSAVAEEGGFSSAARRLNMSPPAVTRAVANLERRLGAQMLVRTTRSVSLTETGKNYLDKAQRLLANIQAADEAAVGINSTPSGELAVTCPTLIGSRFVVPCILDYLQRCPDAQVKCIFLDRAVKLLEEGFEVGIRFGELEDSSMRAIRVGGYSDVVCATPSYLAENGRPEVPADLSDHTLVCFNGADGTSRWRFHENGQPMPIRIAPRVTLATVETALAVAKRGLGLVQLPSYQVAEELSNGNLEVVLEEFEAPAYPIHIVHRESRSQSAKVRAFVDLLSESLRSITALQTIRENQYG